LALGGVQLSRGIAFQHAEAVVACLHALESQDAALLRVEGTEDIVDFEVCDARDKRLRVCQAKTRQEPYTWAPSDIVATIARWRALSDADEARFEFLTDGTAGPELAERLQPALRRAQKAALTHEDREYLQSKRLDPDDPLLTRVVIESRQPDADALLDRAQLRLLRLLEISRTDASTTRANDLINELFRLVALRAGKADPDERVITRAELSEIVGAALDAIDSTRAWDETAQHTYKTKLQEEPPHPSFVMLEAQEAPSQPPAMALVIPQRPGESSPPRPLPSSELLSPFGGAVLGGGPGSGKSTTLELLVSEAVARNLCPVLVSVEGYEAGGLWTLVRDAVERRLGYRLGPTAVLDILNASGAVLLIDGAGELQQETRESLLSDLQQVRREHHELRVLATTRDPMRLRALGLPTFVLRRLDAAQRRQLAGVLIDGAVETVVRGIERRLGGVVENPLLFVMALSLAKNRVYPVTRADLFERFVEGLAARPGGEQLTDIVMALVRDACVQLRCDDAYAADAWTWRRMLTDGLVRLVEQGLFSSESISGEDALQRAHAGGLLRVLPGSGLVALMHDLFCDFFAAEAVRLGQMELPSVLPESLEEGAVFLAERDGLRPTQASAVVSNPVAAARCAAVELTDAEPSDEEATQLLAQLRDHLGKPAADRIADVHLRIRTLDDGLYVFVLPGCERDGASELDVEELGRAARRVAKIGSHASSLGAAVAVWMAELRASLSDLPEGLVTPIPAKREELPAALELAFAARQREVDKLLREVSPGLSQRALRALGMRGLHGVVGPTQKESLPLAGGDVIEHPFTFTYNADDVTVHLSEEVDRDFVEEPASWAIAERWLGDSPPDAARRDVRATLVGLLPGLGP
jgi:hypothetical protein